MSLVRIRSGSAPGGFTFEIETPGGLHYLVYQVIEELGRVLVLDLVTFREP
jgi:hypothetical protein